MSHRTLTAVVCATLLTTGLVVVAPRAEAATSLALAITDDTADPQVPFAGFDGNPPKVFDINGDGKMEIIAQNDNQWVYVFDSETGAILAQVKTTFPAGWDARSFNGPEVALLSSGAAPRMIVANSAATITSYRFNAAGSSSGNFAFVKEWERRLSDCSADPGMDSKPVLADLDRDGRFEILGATEELGLFALRDNGQLLWKSCIGGGNAEPTVADITGDGRPEVVFGSDSGIVSALNGQTGAVLWTYNARTAFNLGSGSMPVGVTIAQLDGVGGPEIVVGARDSHDPNNWANDHALLLALKSNGQLLWGRQHPQANPLTYTHPIVVDADGDGAAEVYWGDWNTIGHMPPFDEKQAWTRTGPANFYRYSATGALVWRQSLDTWWSNKDLAMADVDGDGVQEILANGPGTSGHDGIWYLDTVTGAKETFVDTWPFKVRRGPIVADLRNSGTMQWIVPVGPVGPGSGHGLLVYDTHEAYDSLWPHLPYPVVGPPAPPPWGNFDATFTIKAPGVWWQEVKIQPETPRTIAEVEVRISGGAWQPMALRSWGAWTSSYNTPAGTRVEFLATDSTGGVSQSAPFTWMDGVLVRPNVPPGDAPPPTFTPAFEVPSNVNEWWVEVRVLTSEPLSDVSARVNGGTWIALQANSWGTWSKSFFVATGSRVEFRATASWGAQATSQEFTWLSSGGAFDATFEPRAVGNDWWVEARVTANRPVTAVSANVDGGPWRALDTTSWGTWAKSFFVPDGSVVRFRAIDDAGAIDTSEPVTWS